MDDLKEYSISELCLYNGKNEDGRIFVGLHGKVYDVTETGSTFYGKGW